MCTTWTASEGGGKELYASRPHPGNERTVYTTCAHRHIRRMENKARIGLGTQIYISTSMNASPSLPCRVPPTTCVLPSCTCVYVRARAQMSVQRCVCACASSKRSLHECNAPASVCSASLPACPWATLPRLLPARPLGNAKCLCSLHMQTGVLYSNTIIKHGPHPYRAVPIPSCYSSR